MRTPVVAEARPTHTLAGDLLDRARRHGARHAVEFTIGDGRWSTVTYAELAGRAAALARVLPAAGTGDRPRFVLIMLPNGLDYVVSVYACLLAGVVAVPFYPPSVLTARTARVFSQRLQEIHRDCAPDVVVLAEDQAGFVADALAPAYRDGSGPVLITAGELPAAVDPAGVAVRAGGADLAVLQYTSGSTRTPSGVMLSHDNLVANVRALAAKTSAAEGEAAVSWLPLFHDLGLIGMLFGAVHAGMTLHLTTPAAFARRPVLWLEMIDRARACLTMAPNFAFDLAARASGRSDRRLDLSSLRLAVNGAEPVRHSTVAAFTSALRDWGLRPSAVVPGYGLAEATLSVTVGDYRRPPRLLRVCADRLRRDGVAVPPGDDDAVTVLVGCGTDVVDTESVIVDPDRLTPCPPGTVGEVWVTGPGVAGGYWGQPERSAATFRPGPADDRRRFVRTGDLGVKIDSTLYLVGRVKDMIIQRGVNHCPQDVEYAAECAHPALRPGGTVVFGTEPDGSGPVVVLCELERYLGGPAYPAILASVRAALAEEFGLDIATVGLVRKGQVPKTTSGKVRRRASAQRWREDGFTVLARSPAAVG
ncbi:fatty acyl-AMP ligase [Solwaraspora sp. WMMA2056]|uniref:fatty acyl-AMP ligase n=1 Tax=Solwaraspora sp. WMMA2056 TaxID=3015161 RepID=UPI00259B8182|nr:fatty acyl-AMP ligase [Solwaraspora sp. WMMA2056]WJK38219.1 fatty acyl-AMP ligase [Solwaraspora sp. WMMA2056]